MEDDAAIGLELEPAILELPEFGHHLAEMILRLERLGLIEKTMRQLRTGDDRERRNVIDRFFGIKLRALSARPVENIHDVTLDIEKPELEDREQTAGTCTHDHRIGGNHLFAHISAPIFLKTVFRALLP